MNFVTKYIEDSNAVILLEMASSPSIFYRTSNDDIVDVDQCDAMIDDDDPWIRTTDCTCLGRLVSISLLYQDWIIRFGKDDEIFQWN